MKKVLLTLLLLSTALLANEASSEGGTDIVQRTVNFLLFAGIIYYLIAEPVKGYFNSRSQAIADELEKVQQRLKESKMAKDLALSKVEEAKQFASELLESSRKENKILNEQIMAQCEIDLENITKQSKAQMEFEQRKMVREVVSEIMDEALSEENSSIDKAAMAQIIMKKVA